MLQKIGAFEEPKKGFEHNKTPSTIKEAMKPMDAENS